jgi:hypothetical protein
MERLGIGATEIIKLLNLLILIGYFVLSVVCFIHLRKTDSSPLVKVIWVVLILFFPYMGAIAFLIVNTTSKKRCGDISCQSTGCR